MSKDNKSKFGELFEKSIKELDSDINKFITDKENLKENNSESSDKKIKMSLTYPMSSGRDFDEILRGVGSRNEFAVF